MPEPTDDEPTSPDPEQAPARWRVLKFGGTSVSTASRWDRIEEIVRDRLEQGVGVVLVLSAVSKMTNALAGVVDAARRGEPVDDRLEAFASRHRALCSDLEIDGDDLINDAMGSLRDLLATPVGPAEEANIMSHGEMLSTRLATRRLSSRGIDVAWVDACTLLQAEDGGERDEHYLSARCAPRAGAARPMLAAAGAPVLVTQGFVARSCAGETVLLGRGGSDTSAAYLAAAAGAEWLEIWTDVPGLFTSNPRSHANARLLPQVGYHEAEALAALGAKVLHPRAIEPVREHGIPVRLGWTDHPEIEGTRINAMRATRGVKAITSRSNLCMLSLRRQGSWQPVGFMAAVAGVFARRGLSMDLVSSSCSEIRVTLDLNAFPSARDELEAMTAELEEVCEPRVRYGLASVSFVGEGVGQALFGAGDAFGLFADEAVCMVVHAANERHVSLVLDDAAAAALVEAAHAALFDAPDDELHLGPAWRDLLPEPAA